MGWLDNFKPYSPELRGELEAYLRKYPGSFEGGPDNNFRGPEYFHVIKERGWLIPGLSNIRVNRSPAPDLTYWVNDNLELEGTGETANMSTVGATRGTHDPDIALRDELWSITGLKLEQEEE